MPSRLLPILKSYWQKRIVRVLIGALVLAGAVYAQFLLARIPLPVDVEKSKPPYTPVTAALVKREELIIEKPSLRNTGDTVLLNDLGSNQVTVEAQFTAAKLHDELWARLKSSTTLKTLPSAEPQQIVYVTAGDAGNQTQPPGHVVDPTAKPCQTVIRVSSVSESKLPSEVHFYQQGGPGMNRLRSVDLKPVGADLVVELVTRNLAGTVGPGCVKTLSLGDWSQTFASPVPLKFVLPSQTVLNLSFTPLLGKVPWSGSTGLFEPFELEASPLSVDSITKTLNNQIVFSAKAANQKDPLLLKHLSIGSGELQIDYAGTASVEENGKAAVTFDVWQFAKNNPLLAGLLAMIDAALLEWIRRIVFKSG